MTTPSGHAALRIELVDAGHDSRDCVHPGAPHRHGTRVAYVTDRCRCMACRAANRDAERHRTAALRQGCWRPFVDAEPALEHLELLRRHGVGLDQIVKISRTPKATIRRVLREPAAAPLRIRTETADRVLAIQLSPRHLAPRSKVDATETQSRIRALLDAGHTIPELARALGKSPVSLRRSLGRRTVTTHTATSVRDLYTSIIGNAVQWILPAAVPHDRIPRDQVDGSSGARGQIPETRRAGSRANRSGTGTNRYPIKEIDG